MVVSFNIKQKKIIGGSNMTWTRDKWVCYKNSNHYSTRYHYNELQWLVVYYTSVYLIFIVSKLKICYAQNQQNIKR